MKDLISRSAIKYEQWSVGPLCEPLMVVRKKTIDSIPAVDAVEVKHGRWVEHHNYFQGVYESTDYKCSVCGLERDWLGGANFCPNCGARMDGE